MDVLKSWLRVALIALLGSFIAIGCADTGGGGGEAAAPADEPETVEATEIVAAEGAEEAMAEEGMAEEGMAEEGMAEEGMAEEGMAEEGMAEAAEGGDDGGEAESVPATELAPAE